MCSIFESDTEGVTMDTAQKVRKKRDVLNVRQLRLVSGLAEGQTIASAGRSAGYGAYVSAYDAANSRKVIEALEETRQEVIKKTEFSIEAAHKKYMEAFALAETNSDSKAMREAVDALVALYGLAKG